MSEGGVGRGVLRLPRYLAYPLCLLGGAMLASFLHAAVAQLLLPPWEALAWVDQYNLPVSLLGAVVGAYLLYRG